MPMPFAPDARETCPAPRRTRRRCLPVPPMRFPEPASLRRGSARTGGAGSCICRHLAFATWTCRSFVLTSVDGTGELESSLPSHFSTLMVRKLPLAAANNDKAINAQIKELSIRLPVSYAPKCTHWAADGTPLLSVIKSIYQPGGAIFGSLVIVA